LKRTCHWLGWIINIWNLDHPPIYPFARYGSDGVELEAFEKCGVRRCVQCALHGFHLNISDLGVPHLGVPILPTLAILHTHCPPDLIEVLFRPRTSKWSWISAFICEKSRQKHRDRLNPRKRVRSGEPFRAALSTNIPLSLNKVTDTLEPHLQPWPG